jgi:hypothetical protein
MSYETLFSKAGNSKTIFWGAVLVVGLGIPTIFLKGLRFVDGSLFGI